MWFPGVHLLRNRARCRRAENRSGVSWGWKIICPRAHQKPSSHLSTRDRGKNTVGKRRALKELTVSCRRETRWERDWWWRVRVCSILISTKRQHWSWRVRRQGSRGFKSGARSATLPWEGSLAGYGMLGKVAHSCPTLCNPMDYTVHGILQARVLEWVAFPFSGGSSQPRNQTQVSLTAGRFFTNCTVRGATITSHYSITSKQDRSSSQNFQESWEANTRTGRE